MRTRVLLASASPARLAVLRAAGIDPEVLVSDVDEDSVLAGLAAAPVTERLARLALAKAEAVAARARAVAGPGPVMVLGCDSMLEIESRLVGKPHTPELAVRRWRSMSGRAGTLHTGHAALLLPAGGGPATTALGTRSTTVRFAEVSVADVAAYVATGEPLEVAGAFTLDGYGGWFVDSIDGDPSNVLGISLPLVRELLAELGLTVHDLWR